MLDESIQALLPSRMSDPLDIVFNTLAPGWQLLRFYDNTFVDNIGMQGEYRAQGLCTLTRCAHSGD